MAGKPAVCIGDQTAHGGTVVGPGVPTVLIGGKPAAVMGDNHVCPLVNPGVPPPPHVGGPVMATGVLVMIGGKPAARMGDTAICSGPPDSCIVGCPTVLIGDGGGGGGGAGSGQEAKKKEDETKSVEVEENHKLDVKFVDKSGKPITGVSYKVKLAEGDAKGALTGQVKKSGLKQGNYDIELKAIVKMAWSKKEARVGDKVKLSAEVAGIKNGTKGEILIYKKDVSAADEMMDAIKVTVRGGKIEAEWEYRYPEEREEKAPPPSGRTKYCHPQYYFVVQVDNVTARSGLLYFKDYIEVELTDEEGNPLAEAPFRVFFENGEVREGTLDSNGYRKVQNIPPGDWSVDFPGVGPVTKGRD